MCLFVAGRAAAETAGAATEAGSPSHSGEGIFSPSFPLIVNSIALCVVRVVPGETSVEARQGATTGSKPSCARVTSSGGNMDLHRNTGREFLHGFVAFLLGLI